MIKIIKAYNRPANEDLHISAATCVQVDFDGYEWIEVEFPLGITKPDVLAYFNTNYLDILRQAKLKAQDPDQSIEMRLDLLDVTPKSMASEHIGKLKAVNIGDIKPATITRRFQGQDYDIKCLVSRTIAEMWQSGTLQLDDFVLISFIEEMPNETERNIAIVTDKVYRSW